MKEADVGLSQQKGLAHVYSEKRVEHGRLPCRLMEIVCNSFPLSLCKVQYISVYLIKRHNTILEFKLVYEFIDFHCIKTIL
ncbi:hypothetical protein SAMN05661044_01086 [Olivibacter domesticus]|uniref:Uncharacterized protein n=1 Tax=Olivibacter domesticus TaxID=407022 RepID=A0A1H7JRJ1_OLID1|nr:hypothetical protein SAMN05661044_01086 [Olivibacter domesticus]